MSALPNTTPVENLLNESRLKQLNVASLLVQAGKAHQNGDEQRAALLVGAALIAPKYSGASYLVQGALTANDLRKKL
jgi:hypothetical protein